MNDIKKAINEIEKEIGIPEGFFNNLLNEDDWSFVIKTHALVEAVISFLIVKFLNKNELLNVISFLELSNKRTGKLAFVKAMDLLPKKHRSFINNLSEIRNSLTHSVSNVGVSLNEYFSQLNDKKKKEYLKGICMGRTDDLEFSGIKVSYLKFVSEGTAKTGQVNNTN